jgi:acetyltransferase-like isoleucine patch superfamily enzyme
MENKDYHLKHQGEIRRRVREIVTQQIAPRTSENDREGIFPWEAIRIRATASGNVDHPVSVGDHVFVSPHATLLGCKVESYSYIATGATVVQGATIHNGAIVAVGAFVHANAAIPSEFFIPPNTIAIGDPVRIFSPDEKETLVDAIILAVKNMFRFKTTAKELPYFLDGHIIKYLPHSWSALPDW